MPDVHAGKGCVIGFTANLDDKVIPNIVRVTIGRGMLTVRLGDFDNIVKRFVPSGYNIHESKISQMDEIYIVYIAFVI